jgi:hypothetical protein
MMKQKNSHRTSSGDRGNSTLSLAERILYGERGWALCRLVLLFVLFNLSTVVPAFVFERVSFFRAWHNLIYPSIILMTVFGVGVYIIRDAEETEDSETTIGRLIFLFVLIVGLFSWFEYYVVVNFVPPSPFVGHYMIVPLATFLGAMFAGSKYIQDIYNLESFNLAFLYLVSSLFGLAYPNLAIADGQRLVENGKVNRLNMIGGPGFITVSFSDAVLVHEPPGIAKVYSATTFFVPCFGKIVEVINLHDQRASIDKATAYTKDGIKITVRDVELRFRVWSDLGLINHSAGKHRRTRPYPYTSLAVRDSVFGLPVDAKGSASWADTVRGIVKGKITSYIESRQFDQIVTPDFHKGDPRKQIRDQLFTPETENRLKSIGAKLLWCDIGHFEEDRNALQQHLETWSAKWIGNADVIRAEGVAQRIAYQELGRAEAQADMLISIIHAFDDIELSPENKDQNIRNVILMRTAQVLEALIDTKGSSVINKLPPTYFANDNTNLEGRKE